MTVAKVAVACVIFAVCCGDNSPRQTPMDSPRRIDALSDGWFDVSPEMLHCHSPSDCTNAGEVCCIHYSPGGALEFDRCMAPTFQCEWVACDPSGMGGCMTWNGSAGTCVQRTLSLYDPMLWNVCQ